MSIKLNLLIVLCLLCLASATSFLFFNQNKPFFSQQSSAKIQSSKDKISDLSLYTIQGQKFFLSSYQDKIIFIHFWASWCAPCIVEFPELMKLAKHLSNDLTIIAVSTNANKADIVRFLKKIKTPLPENFIIVWDEHKEIAQDLFQTIRLPETFILSPGLLLEEKIIGASDKWNSEAMKEKLLQYASGKE